MYSLVFDRYQGVEQKFERVASFISGTTGLPGLFEEQSAVCWLVAVGAEAEVHGVLFGSNVHGPALHLKSPSNNTEM